jgi:hypothetical protein
MTLLEHLVEKYLVLFTYISILKETKRFSQIFSAVVKNFFKLFSFVESNV